MKESWDKEIERKLKDATDGLVNEEKKVWNNIQTELFPEYKVKPRKKKWLYSLSAAAIIAFILVGLFTNNGIEKGQAMFQHIRDTFIQKKNQVIDIEGNQEDINVQIEGNVEQNYVLYIDEERYKLVEGEISDRIELKEELPEQFPEVYMEISKKVNTTKEEVIELVKEKIAEDPEVELSREGEVTSPIKAYYLQSMGVSKNITHPGNTPIHRYYILEADQEVVFLIKQVYFLEASEGHGARFNFMLESFEVVE